MSLAILIVDDHPLVAEALREALVRERPGTAVHGATSLAEARSILATRGVDVLLLDWRLGDGTGIELLRELVDERGDEVPAAIVLASYGSPQHVDAAIRLGARGYLLKTAPLDEIVRAIDIAADGGLAFTAQQLAELRRSGWVPLSPREQALVEHVVEGRSNQEIATRLGVSAKAIEAGLARLYERFGLATRTELAVAAERGGWLELPPGPGGTRRP